MRQLISDFLLFFLLRKRQNVLKGPQYRLTKHAKLVILERKIKPEWIDFSISFPQAKQRDRIDPLLIHFLGVIEEKENRVLRVILNQAEKPPVIITAYFDRKMRGML